MTSKKTLMPALTTTLDVLARELIARNSQSLLATIPPDVLHEWRRYMSDDPLFQFGFHGFRGSEREDKIAGRIAVAFTREVEHPVYYRAGVPLIEIPRWWDPPNASPSVYVPIVQSMLQASYSWLVARVLVGWYRGEIKVVREGIV